MTVDVRIQVQGLGVLATLETVLVIPQYTVREIEAACRMWVCHSTDRMWGGLSPWRLWTCNPTYRVWEHGHSRDCGNLTPAVVSVREGYPGDYGCVIPGARTVVVGSH